MYIDGRFAVDAHHSRSESQSGYLKSFIKLYATPKIWYKTRLSFLRTPAGILPWNGARKWLGFRNRLDSADFSGFVFESMATRSHPFARELMHSRHTYGKCYAFLEKNWQKIDFLKKSPSDVFHQPFPRSATLRPTYWPPESFGSCRQSSLWDSAWVWSGDRARGRAVCRPRRSLPAPETTATCWCTSPPAEFCLQTAKKMRKNRGTGWNRLSSECFSRNARGWNRFSSDCLSLVIKTLWKFAMKTIAKIR